jgi:excisionase family DNA binding protein
MNLQQQLIADEVAGVLRITRARVYDLVRQKTLPCVWVGRQLRFRPEDIERFVVNGGKRLDGGWKRTPEALLQGDEDDSQD